MCVLVLPGNGYCRSEAAVVALLTKRSFAKRVYATVINAGNNTDGFKEQGELFFQQTLHKRFWCRFEERR